jgi:uncharacterized protein
MATVLLSIVVAFLVFAAMSLGIIFGRQPIKGSCGGMSAMAGGDGTCQVCGGNTARCPETAEADSGAIKTPRVFDPKEPR